MEAHMSREVPASISRRQFVRHAGRASGLAAAGVGLEGILAARKAPAYPAGTSLHLLLGTNFSPPAGMEIVRQGTDWGKQNHVTVKIEHIPINDLPARTVAALESKQGPDVLQFIHNWQNQYAGALVDMTDLCTALEAKYGASVDYSKAQAMLDGRFVGVPHTITPNRFVARKSYLKAAGSHRWPATWEELRREGKKWKAAGRPIGQTVGHTYGDAVVFAYAYLWSFGAAERDEKGRVVIGSKQMLEALRFWKALWEDAMDPAGT
jgi:multiple sugar transport system substrate-binding protein